MVSSGTVNGDLNTFKTNLTNYNSNLESLDASWRGPSHDNLNNKADEFVSEFQSTIEGEMTAFAKACDLYVRYQTAKTNLGIARANYQQAIANKDEGAAASFAAQIAQLEAEIESLKSQINSALATASATSLSASAMAGVSGAILAGQSLGIDAGTYSDTFVSSEGKKMKYYAYVPEDATEGMPLILYLHGDGSVNDFGHLKNHEMAGVVKKLYGDNAPFILVQPLTEETSWTNNHRINTLSELVQSTAEQYHCDPNKIVVMGGSRGAMGAWELAEAHPEQFSAFVPISGTGNIEASRFTSLPTLAVSTPSGSDSWNYSNMESNVKKINNAGGKAKFSSRSGYNHSTVLYAISKEDFEWMISQTKTLSV